MWTRVWVRRLSNRIGGVRGLVQGPKVVLVLLVFVYIGGTDIGPVRTLQVRRRGLSPYTRPSPDEVNLGEQRYKKSRRTRTSETNDPISFQFGQPVPSAPSS